MAEYRLSHAAERDLASIWRYTRQKWGVPQAISYTDGLLAGFAHAAEFPHHAPACDHIRPGYRRKRIDQHVAYFRVTAYGILVVLILHVQMDTPRHL